MSRRRTVSPEGISERSRKRDGSSRDCPRREACRAPVRWPRNRSPKRATATSRLKKVIIPCAGEAL